MTENKAKSNFTKNPKEQELIITLIFDAQRVASPTGLLSHVKETSDGRSDHI